MNFSSLLRVTKIFINAFLVYRELKLPESKRKKITNKRFAKIIKQAALESKFYAEQLQQNNIKVKDIKSLEDITKLPVTTKDDLRKNEMQLTSSSLNKEECITMATSGSTGVPIKVHRDNKWTSRFIGSLLFFKKMHKISSTNIGLILDITSQDSIESKMISFGKYMTKNMLALDTTLEISKLMNELEKSETEYVITYTGIMRELATLKLNGKGKNLNLKKIFVSGEILDDYTRDFIEKAFNCPCYSLYMSTEGGFIGAECEHKKMHIFSNSVHVEILNNKGIPLPSGEVGTIVLTNLDEGAGTKLIRYNGCADAGTILPEKCSCGFDTPILGPILGRKVDSIHLKNGQVYHPFTMTGLMEKVQRSHAKDRIRQYQIIQEDIDNVTINVVRNRFIVNKDETLDDLIYHIRKNFQEWAKDVIKITVREITSIPHGNNLGMPTPLVISKL